MKIKPCPFCGGEAKTELSIFKFDGCDGILRGGVFCSCCGIGKSVRFNSNISFDETQDNLKAALEMWNTRKE